MTPRTEPAVSARGLSYAYPGCSEPVFQNVVFSAYPGERIALVGPSGCGKTTLLRLLEGSLRAPTGEIARGGRVVLIYQDLRLVEEDTALNNVCMGALAESKSLRFSSDLRRRAQALLDDVGLGELASRRVSELSGGQKQRIAIARALAARPDVLLADEPFANLDMETADRVGILLAELQEKHGFALICSIHDFSKVEGLFQRRVELCALSCPICPVGRLNPTAPRRSWPNFAWIAGVLAVLFLVSMVQYSRTIPSMSEAFQEAGRMLGGMAPWPLDRLAQIPWASLLSALWATVQMAFVGTVLGVIISLPLSLLASLPGAPSGFSRLARGLANIIRSIPALLWALLFVAILGVGPAAGVAALAAYSVGYLTRMFTEELENTDHRPAHALLQMGATRVQALVRGLIKPATPGLAGAGFFVFEYNVRGASVLGLVGAGGIGAELAYYVEWRQFPQLFGGLLLIVLVATLMDAVSRQLRLQLARARGI